ncbi:PRC-barrel domain-containing protein [Halopiger aswanensis]|uniref:Uncharacterized protein n=1 Tax=Halopiger aswanensis TaxID=148449 RepID=A0A419WSH7_9EURY|nr:PRC-barrel domain-containing protein [Halopiger aswanensis]RKD98433.1 hypothetical protein ATJ93_1440 [Halopiger aswanensis]
MTTFTDDDLEKRVENANGEVIGTVTDVDGETARVEPRSGMVDSIKAALGWRQTPADTMTIRADAVDEITPETIRLEATPADGATDASTPAAERTPTDADASSEDQPGDAASPTEIDDRTANGAEPEPTVGDDELDQDRGIATDDSERGLETDDSDGELATGDRASGTDAENDAVDEPIGSATPPEPQYGPNGEGGAERERDRDSERDREGVTAGDIEAQREGTSTGRDSESEPGDGTSSPIEPLTSSDSDDDERAETADIGPDADTDKDAAPASDSDLESDDDSIDIADATAAERPNRVGEPAIDDPVPQPDSTTETTDRGEEGTDEETTTLADEPNIGSGTRSLEDVGGSADDTDSPDEGSGAESVAAEGNLADEVDRGVDIEAAVDESDSDAPAPDAESTDPADELETGPGLEAAVESDEADDSAAGGTADETQDEGSDPALEIEPGIDAAATESAESTSTFGDESERESEPESGPAGQRVDVDTGPGTAMHRELTDEDAPTAEADDTDGERDETPESNGERPRRPSPEGDSRTRSAAGSAATAPLTAAVAAQRMALGTNRAVAKLGATAQRNAARAALAGPLFAQRGTLEFAGTAAQSYTNGVTAMLGTSATSEPNQGDAGTDAEQSIDKALASLEETHSRIADGDEDLSRELSAHLERVRELQSTDEFDRRERIEQVTELLERQTALLRRCQQHLEEHD